MVCGLYVSTRPYIVFYRVAQTEILSYLLIEYTFRFVYLFVFFFFKKKTAYEVRISDWSSDVCSSDLAGPRGPAGRGGRRVRDLAPGSRPGRHDRLGPPEHAVGPAHGGRDRRRHASAARAGFGCGRRGLRRARRHRPARRLRAPVAPAPPRGLRRRRRGPPQRAGGDVRGGTTKLT